MAKKWLMDLILLIISAYINWFPRLNFLDQSDLIHRLKFTLAPGKKDVSLAQEFKDRLEKEHRQNGAIYQLKSKERFMEIKRTERKYHVQDNAAVELKCVKMCCNTTQFPELSFSRSYSKPHGARRLSKHYHLRFDPKLGMGVYAILRIPCAWVACTSMLGKP